MNGRAIVRQMNACLPGNGKDFDNNGPYVRTINDNNYNFDVYGNGPSRTW
jgi:hypothetical protein